MVYGCIGCMETPVYGQVQDVVDAWRLLGMGCECRRPLCMARCRCGDPWVWGADALGIGPDN